jgi:hypothetical protein
MIEPAHRLRPRDAISLIPPDDRAGAFSFERYFSIPGTTFQLQ